MFRNFIKKYRSKSINSWLIFFGCIYIVILIKFVTYQKIDNNIFFGIYSFVVSFYILSRFILAYFYDPKNIQRKYFNQDYAPTVSFGVPSKNEGDAIKETILRIARSDYPKDKFEIIAINDGSTDNTLEQMLEAQKIAESEGVKVMVIDWKENRGKRDGMAECVKQTDKELVLFIDSDSFVNKDTARNIVKYFKDPKVGAVAGHAYVTNGDQNFLTKMQEVRYYVAFKAYKAAEALFGCVTCCSGCCSAYRVEPVKEMIDEWLTQTFLGVRCTYGDDRSLTNFLLKRGYKTLYAEDSIVHTSVPDTWKKFMKQQLRWKKSWIRESIIASQFIWKFNPVMALSYYLGFILPLIAPFVVLRALVWYPYTTHKFPYFYLVGLGLMAVIYGLYYYIYMRDKRWVYGIAFAVFYTVVLIWQMPYAVLKIRDSKWGTR